MRKVIRFAAMLAAVTAFSATAADKVVHHGALTGHGALGKGGTMRVADGAGASGEGVINSVDSEGSVVNLTHGPIPALSWPGMTMDLPVAGGVDLSDVQPGDAVRFRVVLGVDQVYRITAIELTP